MKCKSIFDFSHSPLISVPMELAIFSWSNTKEFKPLNSDARFLFSAVLCLGYPLSLQFLGLMLSDVFLLTDLPLPNESLK